MKKVVATAFLLVLMASSAFAGQREVAICFSYLVGDTSTMDGGICKGKTLKNMYDEGWHVAHMITGLPSQFGFLLERETLPKAHPVENSSPKKDKTRK
ncbi:MAG: hypothetical protein OEL57_09400 [Trichlorobacter sp.]|uniref:hypothetical protein n=1 Tax=Trichlorobacter sp. TaxID=2911007 RepID=UPI0025605FEC|nr:hypothetical protein [Trichlorobacter sp.]MDK9718106.1 hypothetical protein [Trichlorobacter sp.]